ncbi:heat-inducible transcriptional repressor HrcA [Sphingobium subterraneum]|uniref:Heat-inducible transcription repressor HrcA n=1 Tax=Sphingobium subterraneum TaxID=627688 RepID=A0A841IVT1_9SPHN|nr:heat-inducible transcriptional repressor HrcA [Sphingobium subterraneum]MBB6122370.1 heat-inducible transcriptional repressor [Sphingobium subterraneum]
MSVTPISEMSERTRDIFRLVVENYLGTGAPVASRTISQLPGLNLSSASIRNVMQDLEELGLLSSPHISAGRMPTETGLRIFVDGIMQVAEPSEEDRRVIEQQLAQSGPIENALAAATTALSGLSSCAGIVLVPKREPTLRQFSFIPLGQTDQGAQALAVLVGEDGSVENRVIDLPPGVTPSMLTEAGNYLSARLGGLTLRQAQERLAQELVRDRATLDDVARDLVERGLAVWTSDASDRPILIVRGQANLIDEHASADLDRVRQLLEELEGKEEIARLMESALVASATKIFIGSENKLFSLSGSSVIAAPYRNGDGRVIGVVGVIGPTRLNYARVIPMVDFTAQTLSRLIR